MRWAYRPVLAESKERGRREKGKKKRKKEEEKDDPEPVRFPTFLPSQAVQGGGRKKKRGKGGKGKFEGSLGYFYSSLS